MKKRVFVAIGVSAQLKEKVADFQKKLSYLPVRCIKPDNLHVTLIPPWYTTNVEEEIKRLKSIKNIIDPFAITFREVTFGPNPKKPRLIWASGNTAPEVVTLKSKLEEILNKKREKREFSTHLTIGRFKEKDFSKFPIRNLDEKILWEEKVGSFLLMESHLRITGASYEKILEVSFR